MKSEIKMILFFGIIGLLFLLVITDRVDAASLPVTSGVQRYIGGCVYTDANGGNCSTTATFNTGNVALNTYQALAVKGTPLTTLYGIWEYTTAANINTTAGQYYQYSFEVVHDTIISMNDSAWNKDWKCEISSSTTNVVYRACDYFITTVTRTSPNGILITFTFKNDTNGATYRFSLGNATSKSPLALSMAAYNPSSTTTGGIRGRNLLIESVSADTAMNEAMLAAQQNTNKKLDDMLKKAQEQVDMLMGILKGNDKTNKELEDFNKNMTDETENGDGTCRGLICNAKKMVRGIINLPGLIWDLLKTGFTWIVDGLVSLGKTIIDGLVSLGKTIGDALVSLGNFIIDGITALFIPGDGFFSTFFDDLKLFFEEKLGFLIYPFTLIVDVLNRFLSIPGNSNLVINIPGYNLPSVIGGGTLWSATSYDLNQTFSVSPMNTLRDIYLAFVDCYFVFLFVNFCHAKYKNIIEGGSS